MTGPADWCIDTGDIAICGTNYVEYARQPVGERWCFRHRRREHFDRVCYTPDGPSYYDPYAKYEGPSQWCTDLFPGWERTCD